jgi:hypothetical protein
MIEVKKNECDRILLAHIILVTSLSLLGGLAVGIAYGQQEQGEWPLYQNVTYGVSMLYPSNWTQQNGTVAAGDNRFVLVSGFFSPKEANGNFAYVTIGIDRRPPTSDTLLYSTQSIDIYRRDPAFQNFQLVSANIGNFSLAGMPAYSFEITYTDPEFGPQNMLEVGRIFDNRVYSIEYFADPPIYQKYLPIVQRMIESFQITQ